MKKLKRIFAILLAVTLIVPQLPAMKTSASDSDVNLALNKTVVASNEAETPGSNAVDGNLSTRWTTYPNGPSQSLTVDLESVSTINKFVIYNEATDTQKIKEFVIEGSNNGFSFSTIYESEVNEEGFDLAYEVTLSESCEYRYVRITIEQIIEGAVASVSLREFEVWGTAGEVVTYEYEQFNPTVDGNYVLAQNAIANTWSTSGNDGPASYAFNGVLTNHWHTRWDSTDISSVAPSNDWTPTWGTVTEYPENFSEVKDVRAWIGSSFGESINLGKITYKGRSGTDNWILQYGLYVANVTDGEPNDEDWTLVAGGNVTPGTELEIILPTPVQATHFRLVAFQAGTTNGTFATASEIKVYTATEVQVDESDLLKAGSVAATAETVTQDQPFTAGTANSNIFRIPCLITLKDSGNLLAVADARHDVYNDWGGIDTIASVSADGGETWNYSFPIYFPDSATSTGKADSTVAIDPVIVQGNDGTIYCLADVNPTGTTTQGAIYPKAGTGYVTVDGVERLALTSNYDNASTTPTDSDTATFEYYVGDFDAAGTAPVMNRSDNTESAYRVDKWYNIYKLVDGEYVPLTQTQVDNANTTIQQNAFYAASELHVYNTGYIWLVTSEDGLTWEDPQILNSQIKRDNETALLVSPGRGLVTSDGDIVIGCYNTMNSTEAASVFYLKNGSTAWERSSNDITAAKSSEDEIVELYDGTLRMFYRSDTMKMCYADITQDANGDYIMGEGVETNISISSNCNVSAIKLEKTTINNKPVVLVSAPEGPGSWNRVNGRIFVFTINDDNTMNHVYTYHVNEGTFAYSCMTELANGNVGILWEPGINGNSAIRYDEIEIASLTEIVKDIILTPGEAYEEEVSDDTVLQTEPTDTVASAEIEQEFSWNEYQLYNHSGSWNSGDGLAVADLAAFSTTADDELSLEKAEFTLTGDGTSWVAQNEATGQYLRQERVSNVPAFLTDTETTMTIEKVEGDDTFYIYQLQSDGSYRSIIFHYNQMNFNAYSGTPNADYSTTLGTYKLSLLEKQDSVSSDDILPGYKVAETITSGNKYLIAYVWERTTDIGAKENVVFVLYPGESDGTYNVTKLVGDVYVMYDHDSTGSTFSSTENRSISLKTAEFRFEGSVDESGNFTGTIKNLASGYCLTNKDSAGSFFTSAAYDMLLTKNADGEFGFKLAEYSRYILFHTDNTFNGQSGTTTSTFVLLEKQDTASTTDILPGYAKVTEIQSGHDYLITYIDDNDNVYVLYPDNGTTDQTKLVEAERPCTTTLTITGVAKGTTTVVAGDITYNITVKSPIIVSDDIDATAGCEGSSDSEKAGNAVDDDAGTIWHSDYSNSANKTSRENHWITIDLGKEYMVDGLRYLSRSGGGVNGIVTGYEIYYSTDGENFTKATEGTWDGAAGTWYEADYTPVKARYVKLQVTDALSTGSDMFASAAEIQIRGTEILKASDFLGGSLRKSLAEVDADGNIIADTAYENYAKTSIRFGYKIYELEGYTLKSWEWKWGLSEDNLAKTVLGTNKLPAAGEEGVYTSNLVIQNVPVQSYETNIYSKLIVTYTNDATGEDVVVDTGIVSRSVYEVATMAAEEPKEEGDDEYGQAILDAYTAYLGTITQ